MSQKRNRFLGIIFVAFVLFLLLTKFVFVEFIEKIDTFISHSVFLENLFVVQIMRFFSWFSSPFCLFLLILICVFVLKSRKEKVGVVLNLFGIILLNQFFKIIIKRPRPPYCTLILESGYSFPSGHAMVSLAFYGFLTYLLLQKVKSDAMKRKIIVGSCFFIFFIGFSRICLGVHYFSDVVAGFLFSIFYLYLYIRAYQNFKWKKNRLKFLHSFQYAFTGIFSALKTERNMKIHVSIMCFVILLGVYFNLSISEWMVCVFCFSMVIAGEMVNTAIEETVDLITEEKMEKARLAKDIAAGSVLVLAIGSFVIGLFLFVPKFLHLFL